MNRRVASSYPTASTACPPRDCSPRFGIGTVPVSATGALSKLAYTLKPNTNGLPPARQARYWPRSRGSRRYDAMRLPAASV